MLQHFIQGVPCTANNKERRDAWKSAIEKQTAKLPQVETPCRMHVDFHLASEAYATAGRFGPDLDNLLKPLLDALCRTVLLPLGDECVVELRVSKKPAVTDDDAGVKLAIEPAADLPAAT